MVQTARLRVRYDGCRVISIENRLTRAVLQAGPAAEPRVSPSATDSDGARLQVQPCEDGSIMLTAVPLESSPRPSLTITLGPFEASSDPAVASPLRLLSPAYDGMVIDERSEQWAYDLGASPLPMFLLDTGTGGVVVWAERPEDYTSTHVLRRQRSLEVELRCGQPRLLSGQVLAWPCSWRLAAYEGDWRHGADLYAAWLEGRGSCPPLAQRSPAWLQDLRGVARLQRGSSADLLAALTRLAQAVDPHTVLVYYPDWRRHPYDLAYPDYEPSATARELIPAARALGFRVMVHGNFAGMSPACQDFSALQAFSLLDPSGKPIFGGPDICQLNPAFPAVRDRLIEAFVASYRRCPFDALHLDYPALTDAPRRTRAELNPRQGAGLYLRRLAAALPGVALGAEWLDPVLIRHCSLSQQPWMVHSDEESVTPHPLGRYLLGRYRLLYAHLSTPSQNSPAPYGALVWLLRLGELGGLPTVAVGPDFDLHGRVSRALVEAIRHGLARDATGLPQVPGVVFGRREARAPEGLEGWVAQQEDLAFGLDPRSAYWRNSTPPTGPSFRLVSCSQPVQVVGGADTRRAYVHLEPLRGKGRIDLLRMPPDRRGVLIDGAEEPLQRGAAFRPVWADCAGYCRRAIFAHPPWEGLKRGKRKATFGDYVISVPESRNPIFRTYMGLRDLPSANKGGDGVLFYIEIEGARIFQMQLRKRRWRALRLPLRRWRGRTIRLRLGTDAGPAGDTAYDWAVWGEPCILAEPRARIQVEDGRRPRAVIVQDADGLRLLRASEGTLEVHQVALPATIVHLYQVEDLPADGSLLDLPYACYYSFGGAITSAEGKTVERQLDLRVERGGKKLRAVSCHPPFEGQAHREWAVNVPPAATALEFAIGSSDNPHKAFEVWINGQRRWRSQKVAKRGELVSVRVDLRDVAGKPTLITLVVDSLGSNHFDGACFVEPRLVLGDKK